MAAVPNPTGVNTFTGRSDDARGAAVFENLWQGGAFDSQNPKEAAQLREGRAEDSQRDASLRSELPQARETRPDLRVVPPTPPQAEPLPQAESQAADPVADEGPEFSDLDDYLTKSQIERDSFLTLPVTVKVDGKSETVALKELMEGYSREGNYTRRSQELANKQREWEAVQQKAEQTWQQNLNAAHSLFTVAQNQLFADFQGLDQLKQTSPIDWAVKSQEFQQRLGQIQSHLANLNQVKAQQDQQRQQQLVHTLAQEQERMLDIMPSWRDQTRFKADSSEMQNYGRQLGFTDAELSQVYDHRYMQALYEASQYRKLQAQAPSALKKVRAAPQVSSPGTRTVRDPARVAATQTKDAWKKSGYRDQNAGAAYFDTLV